MVFGSYSGGVLIYFLTIIRNLIGHILIVPWTIFVSVLVILLGALGQHDLVTFWMALWSKMVLWFYGVEVIREGLEKLPAIGGGVLLFNHQSHFDVPAVTAYSGRRLRYGAKIELFKIPFFGAALRASGCLPIARDNRSQVMRVYEEAANKFREGVIFALAPEGTRQSSPSIGPFKKGPFVFATRSQVPVVPVIIEGADRVMPKGTLFVNVGEWKRKIHIRAFDPIYPEKTDRLEEAQVMEAVTRLSASAREVFIREFDLLRKTVATTNPR